MLHFIDGVRNLITHAVTTMSAEVLAIAGATDMVLGSTAKRSLEAAVEQWVPAC